MSRRLYRVNLTFPSAAFRPRTRHYQSKWSALGRIDQWINSEFAAWPDDQKPTATLTVSDPITWEGEAR